MRYCTLFLFIILTQASKAQVMLPAYQGVQYKGGLSLPVVTTDAVTTLSGSTASAGGNVSGTGVTARGVCWDTNSGPTTALSTLTVDGTGTGSFSSSITGLVSGTYYVRAYATNSIGTAYGNEVSFTIVSLNIGDSYQGGKVAYLDATGQHGLIVSNSDLGSYNWSNAISICQNYSVIEDGVTYDDWYLPNKGELNLLRNIKGILGMTSPYYWSSTAGKANYAWEQNFVSGKQNEVVISGPDAVRAIRAF